MHTPAATFSAPVAPKLKPVPGLMAYSAYDPSESGMPQSGQTVQVPPDIPFASATGNIIAYIKLDTLLLSVPSGNTVLMAFALEDGGIPRDDIVSTNDNPASLLVRVRPLSRTQIEKIISIVKAHQGSRPLYWSTGFVSDCNAVFASLGALAVIHARDHARLLAEAAQSRLGGILGVVDSGARMPDALCGPPKNAPVQQFASAAVQVRQTPGGAILFTPQLYARVIRSVSAAWRMDRLANPPGRAWQDLPEFQRRWWARERPAFISDGLRVYGGSFVPHAIEPNRATIALPDWTLSALRTSPYAGSTIDVSFGIPPFRPVIQLRAANTSQLKARLGALLKYLRTITPPKGASLDLSFHFSQDDCSIATGEALYEAARDAIAKVQGHLRYLDERGSRPIGPVSCTYEPGRHDQWSKSPDIPSGVSISEVDAGY